MVEGLEGRALLSTLTVYNNGDSGSGSLRAVAASAHTGDVIKFSPTLDGQNITLTSGVIDLTGGVSIQGPGHNLLTILGNNSSGIFKIKPNAAAGGVPTSISGLWLFDGAAPMGAAIDNTGGNGPLEVSNCDFGGNLATVEGGAIASSQPLSIDQCFFLFNRVVARADSVGAVQGPTASGGAIWCDGSSLAVTNSKFYANSAAAGTNDAGVGAAAEGGAITWGQAGSLDARPNVSVSITDNTFADNAALGGNNAGALTDGGSAAGGAVVMYASHTDAMFVDVSDNTFTDNTATGGMGYNAGDANGGSLLFDAEASSNAFFYAYGDQFHGGGAYGGATDAYLQARRPRGAGGSTHGGAVALYGSSAQSPWFCLYLDQVTGATSQGGSAQRDEFGYLSYAVGGYGLGGGVYLEANSATDAHFIVWTATLSSDTATGGVGGSDGLNGMAGGIATGGGLSARADGTATVTFAIDQCQINNCSATGGAGGPGYHGYVHHGNIGGDGGGAGGGGVSLSANALNKTTFILTNDTLKFDGAQGGAGGRGGDGTNAVDAGPGGAGGDVYGGGLYYFQDQGASALTTITNCQFLFDQAVGGTGGTGGDGYNGGNGGVAGYALGGGVDLDGTYGADANQVDFFSDTLFGCLARGGNGGFGGVGIVALGGAGGAGSGGMGGGLAVYVNGAVDIYSSHIISNTAAAGIAAEGGYGPAGFGATGIEGYSQGGGIDITGVSGETVNKSLTTVVGFNNAEYDPDISGPIGTC
jgi:hypothetical protein